MSDDLEATLKRMDELQIAFLAKLGEKVKELSRLILLLDATLSPHDKKNKPLLVEINQLSHSLAGTAGTFKHTSIYTKAKAIETLSDDLSKFSENLKWYKLLIELISALRAEVKLSGRPSIVENFSSSIHNLESKDTDHKENLDFKNCTVIVVDDDELLVTLIKEQAKHFEYNIIPLLSTEDLEEAIDEHQPMAILMDVVFPDAKHSGIEIINQLKAQNKIHCPVIFMSNRCDVVVRLDALRAGSDAFIVKPIEILELIRVLDRLTQKLSRKKSRILIVDDEPVTAELYKLTLEKEGFICTVILDAMEVFNKALSFQPDAILLDVNMPNCNGFEVAEIIRQDDSFTHVPILFLTTDNTSKSEIQAMKSGGDDFLDKNEKFSTLIEIIKGHVQRYKELDSVLSRLKRDEVRFRSVTSSSSDAIITVDTKNRIIFWNEGAENILGYHSLEAIGQPLDIIFTDEDKEKYQHGFEEVIKNEGEQLLRHRLESVAVRKDKVHIDIELTYTVWRSGNEKFYTSIIRDVTERKKIERELYHKEASLNAIVSSSGEGIVTINSAGIIEMANPKAAQLFGYQVDELVGKNVAILVPDSEKKQHDDYVRHSEIHAPRVINNARELQGQRKDGSLFALELNVSPMNVEGERKFVGILHDISTRKSYIDELSAAKEGAEAANKAKSQFLSSMSHELRTPLNAILGFTQILQTDDEEPPTTDQLDSLDHIYNSGMHLLALITEVLDLSRIESGNLPLDIENIDLVNFTHKTLIQLNPLAVKADIQLKEVMDFKKPLFIAADKVKLKQVINNLLSNAIKYNRPKGLVIISIVEENAKVRLLVKDTGKGIAKNAMKDLFTPFNRLGAESGSIEGTGIGLTITQKLVEMMNGKILVSSKLNEGTSFTIEFDLLADIKQNKITDS
ncbi:MAG: PAS domain S-box protein [Methylococcaceae bacterium]|nr:PAS domain S-box protein [Methylococcaceae bacterium]